VKAARGPHQKKNKSKRGSAAGSIRSSKRSSKAGSARKAFAFGGIKGGMQPIPVSHEALNMA